MRMVAMVFVAVRRKNAYAMCMYAVKEHCLNFSSKGSDSSCDSLAHNKNL